MLLMQAFCCEVARAFTKLGIAMAANKPMMATTIMISTRVKPALRDCFICFILYYFLFTALRWNFTTGGLYDDMFVHLIACDNRTPLENVALHMPRSKSIELENFYAKTFKFPPASWGWSMILLDTVRFQDIEDELWL